MTTFRELCGNHWNKNAMIARCGGGGSDSSSGGGSDSSSGGGRSEADVQAEINSALSASGGEWTSELNGLVSERDTARSSASTATNSGSRSTSNTGSPATSNTMRMNLANTFTPNDGMSYSNGVLSNDDGSRVTENTAYQDLANVSTAFDGASYSGGQLSTGTGIGVGDTLNGLLDGFGSGGGTYTPPASFGGNDGGGSSRSTTQISPSPTAPASDSATATNATTLPATGGTLADNLNSQIAALQTQLDGLNGQTSTSTTVNNTSLPDDYLTEADLAKYLADLDLSSNAYDPAAFMNAYGFAMDPTMMGELIGTYQSDTGMYQRRAVKDRETGEIRYVNVPIGAGAMGGNAGLSQFQRQRRNGFSAFV